MNSGSQQAYAGRLGEVQVALAKRMRSSPALAQRFVAAYQRALTEG